MEILAKILKKPNPQRAVAKKPDEDFIPYVCHYDPETIITKNGEILQVIRITGFNKESIASDLVSLRDTVRDAIADNVKDNKFAFWFHTIRRKKNIVPPGEFSDFFCKKLNDDWVEQNHFKDQFVNELYITIIAEGFDSSIMNFQSFSRSFSYKSTQKLHKNFISETHKKLSKLTLQILAEINEYGAKLLTINDWQGVLYSEPMRFFGKICNLHEGRYPLNANDISSDLSSSKLAFGQRELEVINQEGKNFAAILSLKEYHEVSTGLLDKILQQPIEFIISQSFDFSFDRKDLEVYEHQNYIAQISGDEDFRQLSGIANFIESNKESETDYGKLQTTIMIINSDKDKLESDILLAFEKFTSLGFVLVREDLYLEHCFWAQLPGNFAFLRRQKIINTLRTAGFAALHSFPCGAISGNHWGSAVTVLKTIMNTPYFFNFHDKDLGHTLITGAEGSGKTTFTNFLLAQSRKFDTKIIYFDSNQAAKVFFKAINGNYFRIVCDREDPEFLHMNPFLLKNTAENITFVSNWIQHLLMFLKGEIPDHEIASIPKIVEKILQSESPSFLTLFNFFNTQETRTIYKKLKIWNGEKLGNIFSSYKDIDWSQKINAFDLSEVIDHKPILIPVMTYLLHKIIENLNGEKTIVVFDEAWEMLDNQVIAPDLSAILQKMREKNCMVIFAATTSDDIGQSEISNIIKENLATEIYLSDPTEHEFYTKTFELADDEIEIIKMMDINDRNFLLRHGGESLIATFNLSDLHETAKILSADQITIAAADEVIKAELEKNPEEIPDPKNWIPHLIEILQEFEKDKKEEERRSAKEQLVKDFKQAQEDEKL